MTEKKINSDLKHNYCALYMTMIFCSYNERPIINMNKIFEHDSQKQIADYRHHAMVVKLLMAIRIT